jgi:hypothetical protein
MTEDGVLIAMALMICGLAFITAFYISYRANH